ncbi:MAG: SDR family NAD(P)-dependent oxidoreductase, partial [Rhodospirillaceae bacterium]|nr:SDR family NAD(P)-dependent oxidoreductase [Rhodospirillaceae bacterium]
MTQFENKVCIVTGGASGIGAKTAEMFVQRGGQVVIGDVNDEAGEGLAAAIGD